MGDIFGHPWWRNCYSKLLCCGHGAIISKLDIVQKAPQPTIGLHVFSFLFFMLWLGAAFQIIWKTAEDQSVLLKPEDRSPFSLILGTYIQWMLWSPLYKIWWNM